MRTINVDALIEKFEKDKFDRCRDDYQSGYNDGMLHAEVVADNFPTVDAVPVKHGKWIQRTEYIDDMGFTGCRCSECNYWKPMGEWHYCPNCGARMDAERENNGKERTV